MKPSARCLDLIKSFEGCKLSAYFDGGGVLTIGYGHTGPDVKAGMKISQGEADELLLEDVEEHALGVDRWLGSAPTKQHQYDAMVSLAFNIGLGNANHRPRPLPGFSTSTVLRRHKQGNFIGAANAFVMWNKDNGKIVRGLTRRREAEARLYRGEY